MKYHIRQETPSDYAEAYNLVELSFATVDYLTDGSDGVFSDEPVADYLNGLRGKDTFIPELSLIAEHENGKIIGQIVLYKTNIITADKKITELVLSPICVHPDYFRQGIARAMIEKALEIAKKIGYTAVFLCGEPKIYRRMGFTPSYEYGIYHVSDKDRNAEWCMVRELVDGALNSIDGTVDIV